MAKICCTSRLIGTLQSKVTNSYGSSNWVRCNVMLDDQCMTQMRISTNRKLLLVLRLVLVHFEVAQRVSVLGSSNDSAPYISQSRQQEPIVAAIGYDALQGEIDKPKEVFEIVFLEMFFRQVLYLYQQALDGRDCWSKGMTIVMHEAYFEIPL